MLQARAPQTFLFARRYLTARPRSQGAVCCQAVCTLVPRGPWSGSGNSQERHQRVSDGATWRAPPQGPHGATARHGYPPTHIGARFQEETSSSRSHDQADPLAASLWQARASRGGEIHEGYSPRACLPGTRPKGKARRTGGWWLMEAIEPRQIIESASLSSNHVILFLFKGTRGKPDNKKVTTTEKGLG